MTKSDFIEAMQTEFAKYGFTHQPLSLLQLGVCYAAGLCTNVTYHVGCDVNAGLSFERALNANS